MSSMDISFRAERTILSTLSFTSPTSKLQMCCNLWCHLGLEVLDYDWIVCMRPHKESWVFFFLDCFMTENEERYLRFWQSFQSNHRYIYNNKLSSLHQGIFRTLKSLEILWVAVFFYYFFFYFLRVEIIW